MACSLAQRYVEFYAIFCKNILAVKTTLHNFTNDYRILFSIFLNAQLLGLSDQILIFL